ncbi:MAG: N-formylglutamate deformylase [Caulobacteraceae bacterium]
MNDWLSVERGEAPLIVSVPHAGLAIPYALAEAYTSPELARSDSDFHVDRLYAFARDLGATIVRTAICRTVIDLNRDPSGASLYPGRATTELCPTTSFDGAPLYRDGCAPNTEEIARRQATYFDPYHDALEAEIVRLQRRSRYVVLYVAHSIRSHVPRLFDGELPLFNIGSFDGASCAQELTDSIADVCGEGSCVVNGRFKGGWITRRYGAPARGVHAVQMEIAMRGYLDENGPWPPAWDAARARPLQTTLMGMLTACLVFVDAGSS